MQTYEQTIPAGGVWSLHAAGRFFRIIEASNGPVDVLFFRNGIASGAANAVGAGYWTRPADLFSRIEITSASAQRVKIAIADGDGGYDVVGVTGVVSVSDASFAKVVENRAFTAVTSAVGSSAGTLPVHSIWNPVGSGKKIVIRKASVMNANASLVIIYGIASAQIVAGANPFPKSFLADGADSNFRVYSGNAGAVPVNKQYRIKTVNPNAEFAFSPDFPVVVTEGKSFIVYGNAPTTAIGELTVDWEEVPN